MIPERLAGVAWQVIDGQAVLLRIRENEALGLNTVGRLIWELADGTRSIDRIADAVAARYGISPEAARADTLRFIEELRSIGVLALRMA